MSVCNLWARTPKEIANQALEAFSQEDFKKATTNFDAILLKLLTPDKLEATWKQLVQTCGKFKNLDSTSKTKEIFKYQVIYRKLYFENLILEAEISVNKENKIAGFRLLPVQEKAEDYIDADYVKKDNFSEIEVTFDDKIIKGNLTLPNISKTKKVPALVLVHGSGAHDRDETIFNSKPFRDIAYGLSSNGIAVLRYDKRTFADKNINVKMLTMTEETVNDAILAIKLLKTKYSDKISNIYVLGHSQGGYMLPRIAKRTQAAKGFISLAGNARPLEDLIVEQFEYILNLPENNKTEKQTKDNQKQLKNIKIACKRIKERNYNVNTPADSLPLNLSPNYWKNLQNYNPVREFVYEKRPILFIQGGRDYQVTEKDFNLWKNALNNHNNKFVFFKDLNHLMQKGEKKSTPTEYMNKGYVDKRVIDEIIKWIKEKN